MQTIDTRTEGKTPTAPGRQMVNVPLIVSGSLFALMLAMSIFLFFGNHSLTTDISNITAENSTYDASIAKLKNDPRIAAAELIGGTQSEILRNIRTSEAQRYTSELENIAKKYKINFTGFSYQGGKISTAAAALASSANPTGDAIEKVSKIIGDYRSGSGSIFRLSPVTTVSGQEQERLFPIEFIVNENTIQ